MKKLRVIAVILLLSFTVSVSASAFSISAKGGCSMDFDTGEILFSKNANTPMTPASMTKIMTLYLIFEKLAEGKVTKSSLVTVSQNAAKEAARPGYTNIPLSFGENVSLDTLISGITTVSACGACTAAAEYIAGTEAAFVTMMNNKAAELGLNAKFTDASGISDYNQITPASLATLVRLFITKYPDILNYTKKPSVTIKGKTYSTTNLLLKNTGYFYSGADGFKTGTTNKAGKCIVSTASRNGRRIISVIMNAPTNDDRYKDSIKILDSAFGGVVSVDSSYMYSTDVKTYIDGFEIPCCYYLTDNSSTLCVVAENLESFGFDISYDSKTSTLYIYDVPGKEIYTMVPTDLPSMTPLYKIHSDKKTNVVLVKDNVNYTLKTVYTLSGMCAVSIDELGKYFSYSWDGNTRCAYLNAG